MSLQAAISTTKAQAIVMDRRLQQQSLKLEELALAESLRKPSNSASDPEPNGNCCFSLFDFMFGPPFPSSTWRQAVHDWLLDKENADTEGVGIVFGVQRENALGGVVDSTWSDYCKRIKQDGQFADHLTLVAASHIARRRFQVIRYQVGNTQLVVQLVRLICHFSG